MPRSTGENHKLFPDKEARYACWNSRDSFWACVDKKGESDTACSSLRAKFEELCPATWVKHFDRKRQYEMFKEKLKVGYDPVDHIKNKTV